ncbi:MAG: DUF1254 domain-containing protein [Thermodesulfobacteriota bacterium]
MNSKIELASDIYLWGLPLVIMHRTRSLHSSRGGSGVMRHRRELTTARKRTVVGPNNDTLYSSGWYDLRAGDLELQVPPMDHPNRYWSVMFLDAFTHVTYVSRRQYGVKGASVKVTYDPGKEHDHSRPAERIVIGTPTVWVLVRTLVDGPADLLQARAVQEGVSVIPPGNKPPRVPTSPPLGRPDQVYQAGPAFFDELRTALGLDPPASWHPNLNSDQQAFLKEDAEPEILAAGVEQGNSRVQSLGFGADRFKNGWGTRSKGTQFGDDILLRAACAQFTLAGHHRVENASYTALRDIENEPLDGSRPLTLTFPPGEEPPAQGFWSLTVYGPDMFFYDNPLNRYSLGDRSPELQRTAQGLSLTIGGPTPSETTNWLPAPPGPYRLGLRIYEGRQDVVEAKWFPPPLRSV